MNIRFSSTFHQGQRGHLSRALAYVLLGLIVYGFSVGTAYRHEGFSSSRKATVVTDSSKGPSVVDLNADNPLKPGDCQICQFRQSLSNGALFSAVLIQSVDASPAVASLLAISKSSDPQATCRGRAPPAIS